MSEQRPKTADDFSRAELLGEARRAICPDCNGKRKRLVPNARERAQHDIAPAFMLPCPTCFGSGRAALEGRHE